VSSSISLKEISKNWNAHNYKSDWYRSNSVFFRNEVENATNNTGILLNIESIGDVLLPNFSMGNISTIDLFGLDELVIFSYYQQVANSSMNKALDLGANIGLHSLVLARLGYEVTAYEPDPIHAQQFIANQKLNDVKNVNLQVKAVSTSADRAEFVRVKGNTTGSHLAGSPGKKPYGELETFSVDTEDIKTILFPGCEFSMVKMDVEGYEAKLISELDPTVFENTNLILEVGSIANAQSILQYIHGHGLVAFSQKTSWKSVKEIADLPSSYREGALLIPVQKNLRSNTEMICPNWP